MTFNFMYFNYWNFMIEDHQMMMPKCRNNPWLRVTIYKRETPMAVKYLRRPSGTPNNKLNTILFCIQCGQSAAVTNHSFSTGTFLSGGLRECRFLASDTPQPHKHRSDWYPSQAPMLRSLSADAVALICEGQWSIFFATDYFKRSSS
jgi:hypothetical protein